MAISTYKTFLMKGTGTGTLTYSKLIDIKDYAGLEAEPEMLDATTLSDGRRKMIPGIDDASDGMTFTCNYSAEDYATIKALDDGTELDFGIWFGGTEGADGTVTPTGSDGKFTFKGTISVRKSDGGVNEVSDMVVTIYTTTKPAFSAS